jgi:hypothetical protein
MGKKGERKGRKGEREGGGEALDLCLPEPEKKMSVELSQNINFNSG